MGNQVRSIAIDAATKALTEALDAAVSIYEARYDTKLDPKIVGLLNEYVKQHTVLLIDVSTGKLQKKHAVEALVRLANMTGIGTDSGWIGCGVAIFEVGMTGMNWTSNTMKVARISSFVAATGAGAAAGMGATVTVALFGVFMTTKDAIEAAEKCNAVISKKALEEKRPPVVVNNKGYNLGQISIGFLTNPLFGEELVCSSYTQQGARASKAAAITAKP